MQSPALNSDLNSFTISQKVMYINLINILFLFLTIASLVDRRTKFRRRTILCLTRTKFREETRHAWRFSHFCLTLVLYFSSTSKIQSYRIFAEVLACMLHECQIHAFLLLSMCNMEKLLSESP